MRSGQVKLKQRSDHAYCDAPYKIQRDAKQLYYELLGIWFHKETFTDHVEQLVMERRAHGIKIKSICTELAMRGERCHRDTVRGIIQKFEKKWGVR